MDAQSDGRIGFGEGGGKGREMEFRKKGAGNDTCFHEGKLFSDADAWAEAEGEVGCGGGGEEAIREEALRVFPKVRMAMDGVRAGHDRGTTRDGVAGNLVRTKGMALNDPDGWGEAEGFLKGPVEGGGVVGTTGLFVGVMCEVGKEPSEGVGSGIVAGEKKGDGFVADVVSTLCA